MTPGGSNFESIFASEGVTITEAGKNKIGKSLKASMSKSMTRDQYMLDSSRTINNKTLDFTLPNLRESKMNDTIEMNSTIMSNKVDETLNINKKMNESHSLLPPIEDSRISLGRNTSMFKLNSNDKINTTDKSINFIKHSMIFKPSFQDKRMRGSKSEASLISLLPDKRMPLSILHATSKIDSGMTLRPMMRVSGSVMTNDEGNDKKFDEFNRQLLYNSMVPEGSTLNPLLKFGKKPKLNRSKYFIDKSKPVLLNQEHRDNKKAYIDRILELKQNRKIARYAEL
jgi:hypothetical protein